MRVFHIVVEFDTSISDIIEDIKSICKTSCICGATEDALTFLEQQLKETNI